MDDELTPMEAKDGLSVLVTMGGLAVLLAGVGLVLFMPAMTRSTQGATTSVQLKWEERRAEIARVAAEAAPAVEQTER